MEGIIPLTRETLSRDWLIIGRIPKGSHPMLPYHLAKEIVRNSASKFDLDPEDITGPRRFSKMVQARDEAIDKVRKNIRTWSYTKIGKFFNRDHTSIMESCRRTKRRERND